MMHGHPAPARRPGSPFRPPRHMYACKHMASAAGPLHRHNAGHGRGAIRPDRRHVGTVSGCPRQRFDRRPDRLRDAREKGLGSTYERRLCDADEAADRRRSVPAASLPAGLAGVRDADAQARASFFASRRGTMYVPMQAASETAVTRDRAVQLEARVRVYAIDG
jgi:hypothetical protein